MKLSLSAVCLVAGIGVGGMGLAHAADEAPALAKSIKNAAETFRHHREDPAASAQKRLDRLGKKLNLNDAQQAAWQSYSAAMFSLAQQHAQARESRMTGNRSVREDMSTPDKLEKMAERLRRQADSLGKVASDTRLFYAQLAPQQQTIFDLYAKDAWRSRMRERIHAGMPRG